MLAQSPEQVRPAPPHRERYKPLRRQVPTRIKSPRVARGRAPVRLVAFLWVALALTACSPFVKPTLPGQSDYDIAELHFPEGLALDHTLLRQTLAVRPDVFLIPGQPYNPWRQAEDRRRIAAFWKNYGYFDIVVDKAEVSLIAAEKKAIVRWNLSEGPRYTLRKVEVVDAPPAFKTALEAAVTFGPGTPVDLQKFRVVRHALADILRDAGHLRCEVYSRTFVDPETKSVDWSYFVDAGPKTEVGEVTTRGARKVSADALLERVGYQPGDPLDLATLRKRELDLMDTGAFAHARIHAATGTEFESGAVPYESWIPPDTGGIIKPYQVDADGRLVPRTLSRAVDLRVEVVEAPSTQVQMRAAIGVDLERIDPVLSTRIIARNALGEQNHLIVEGDVGYGLRWRGDVDDPLGIHGGAKLQWSRPGTIGRTGDMRLTLSFDEGLYPGFHWRTAAAGLGLRTLIDTGLFFDIEPRFRWDEGVGLGTIDATTLDAFDAAAPDTTLSGEARLSLVWDQRNDPVEALSGHLMALRLSVAPVGDLTWLRGEVDLRLFVPFNADLGLAFKASAGWVAGLSDEGAPIGARLFGGGAWGHRGFGTRRLSLYGNACGGAAGDAADCRDLPLGASSLFEGGVELRWLPFRKQFGAILFADIGAVGRAANPFEDAIELAVGGGLRIRLWHIPIGLDVAWRATDDPMFARVDALDQVLVFLRVGEAF